MCTRVCLYRPSMFPLSPKPPSLKPYISKTLFKVYVHIINLKHTNKHAECKHCIPPPYLDEGKWFTCTELQNTLDMLTAGSHLYCMPKTLLSVCNSAPISDAHGTALFFSISTKDVNKLWWNDSRNLLPIKLNLENHCQLKKERKKETEGERERKRNNKRKKEKRQKASKVFFFQGFHTF